MKTIVFLLLSAITSIYSANVELELPSTGVPNVRIQGKVKLINLEKDLASYELPQKTQGVEATLHTNNKSSRTQIINGKVTKETSFPITFIFLKKGTYNIQGITFVYKDKTKITSNPVTINITEPRSDLSGDIIPELKLLPNSTIVPGEPVSLEYTVYLKGNNTINTLDGIILPKELIAIDEEWQKKEENTTYDKDGTTWLMATFTKKITVAKPGTYKILGQQKYGEKIRAFIGTQLRQKGTVPIRPINLTVSPLPTKGRPDDFVGIIGKINLIASLERKRISNGEGVSFSIEVSGRQLDLITKIKLPKIKNTTVYDKEPTTENNKKTFTYDLVPTKTGTITIPSVKLSYYDPKSNSYRYEKTSPLQLEVIPGRNQNIKIVGKAKAEDKTKENQIIPQNKILNAIGSKQTTITIKTIITAFIASLFVSLLFFTSIKVIKTKKEKGVSQKRILKQALSQNDLDTANNALHRLLPSQKTTGQKETVQKIIKEIENARFGNGSFSCDEKIIKEINDTLLK